MIMKGSSNQHNILFVVCCIVLFIIFVVLVLGYASYMQCNGIAMFFGGIVFLYLGWYSIKKRDAPERTLITAYAVRKKNLKYYDTERMAADMGKSYVVISISLFVCGVYTFFIDELNDDTFLWVLCILILILAILMLFMICIRSRYLKDPNVTSP